MILPGEDMPIALTPAQAAIMRVLCELKGVSIDRATLMRRECVALEKPVEAFARNRYAEANRAYRTLITSDRRGRYRASHNALPLQR